jgi:hypothetical protein
MPTLFPLWRYRTTGKQCGLTATGDYQPSRSLSMADTAVDELLTDHVTLAVEGIDRIYLNAYQPMLQTGGGLPALFKGHHCCLASINMSGLVVVSHFIYFNTS